MSNLVIVAIPDENDRVWKISSEKVPHLTLLFLGGVDEVGNVDQIVQFVEHAANTTLRRFYLPVDRRGELGEDKADVLFFKKGRYDYKAIRDFRMQLLKDNNIRTAYDSADQFEGPWNPHLTLGYPTDPAKPDETDRDFGFYDVAFNKVAVWLDDFEGPEFLLKDFWDEFESLESVPMDVVMSGVTEAELAHYGVKGMRWGVRKERGLTPGETKREGIQKFLDPTGHRVGDDIAKVAIGALLPPVQPLTWPAHVRLYRGGGRGVKAKLLDSQEKKFAKNAMSPKNFVAIHNGSLEKVNRGIDELNQKYPDVSKPATKKKYDDAVLKTMQDGYRESANSLVNKANTMHLDVEFKNDGLDFKIKAKQGPGTAQTERVKHAADDLDNEEITVEITGKIKRTTTGHIVGLEFDDLNSADSATRHSMELGAEYLVHAGLMTPDYFLEHHGVKGMHWGVRKENGTSGDSRVAKAAKVAKKVGGVALTVGTALADSHFETRLDTQEGQSAVQREVAGKAKQALKRTDLPAIKAKPEYQKAKKLPNRLRHPLDPATKAYRKEVKAAYINRLEDAANSMTNVSGTRQYTVRERGWELPAQGGALPVSKYYWGVTSRQIKHADDGGVTTWHEVIMDDDGFVTDIVDLDAEPTNPALAQTMDLGVEFLAGIGLGDGLEHYGVKGMHWGVRKAPPSAVDASATSRVPHGTKRKTRIEVAGGENHPAHEDAIAVAEAKAKLKKSGTAALSNAELQKMAKRLQLESQVAQLTSSRGQKFISRQFEQQGQQAVQYGVRKGGAHAVKKGVKKAGKVAATTAATAALL